MLPLISGTTSSPACKSPNKWNLKAVIKQFNKEEKEFDKEFNKALEACKNTS
jgi:hypothetical protein